MSIALELPRHVRRMEQAPDWTVLLRTALVGLLAIGVKTAGAAKTVFVARFFPPGTELDAFLIAFLLPAFLSDILAGALSPTLVPSLVEALRAGRRSAAVEVYSWALWRILPFLSVLAAALLLGCLAALQLPAPQQIHLTLRLSAMMLPILPLTAVTNVWRSALHAQNRFALAAAVPVLTPLITILSLFVLPAGMGVFALAAGTVTGVFTEFLLLGVAVKRAGFPCFPAPVPGVAESRLLMHQYRSLVTNNFLLGSSIYIDQAMAATLGSGALSILNFGTRLVAVLLAIGPTALSTTILPRLSEIAARHDRQQLRRALMRYLVAAAALAIPVTVALICYSQPLIRLVFRNGALSGEQTAMVAEVQSYALLQLPFSFLLAILSRTAAALKASHVLVPLSVCALVVNIFADLLFMRIFGVAGIALSTAMVQGLLMAGLTGVLYRRLK